MIRKYLEVSLWITMQCKIFPCWTVGPILVIPTHSQVIEKIMHNLSVKFCQSIHNICKVINQAWLIIPLHNTGVLARKGYIKYSQNRIKYVLEYIICGIIYLAEMSSKAVTWVKTRYLGLLFYLFLHWTGTLKI